MRQLGEDAGRGCDRYGNASEMRGTCALICTYLDAQLCTSVCICRIDAAISDAPKPIGWLLWVRASYYLHVGRPAGPRVRHHTAQTAGCTSPPRVHKRVTSSAPSCREIRIAASHKSREIGAEIRIPGSPPSRENRARNQNCRFTACPSCGAGITLTNLSSKSPHVSQYSSHHHFVSHGVSVYWWDRLAVLSNVKV